MGAVSLMKKILVILSHSPFDGLKCREALDTALIFAALDQKVSMLFQHDAVFCLKPDQSPEKVALKNFFKTLKTLELYDVEDIFVSEPCMKMRNISSENLLLDVTSLSHADIKKLYKQQDHLVSL